MKKIFERRGIATDPLLAHSYERVMPGRNYVASIRDFWRVCSGINEAARARVTRFLTEVLNTEKFPSTVLDRPIESETAKIVENSYRATLLAFMDEWSLFAERNGVDLKKVIDAIKVRPTHSNIMFPWSRHRRVLPPQGRRSGDVGLQTHLRLGGRDLQAHAHGDRRERHASPPRPATGPRRLAQLGKPLAAAEVLVCGASYREDVGDTRYSGSRRDGPQTRGKRG